jgi:hypothetical protein
MFSLDETRLELHASLTESGSPFTPAMAGIWDRAQAVCLAGAPGSMLCPEDMLLHLSLHAAYHHVGLVLAPGLRALCDVAFLLDCHRGRMDWHAVVERAGAWHVRRAAYLVLRAARLLLEADVPDAVLAQLDAPGLNRRLMDGVLELVRSNHYGEFRTDFPLLAELCLQRGLALTRPSRLLRRSLLAASDVLTSAYAPGTAPRPSHHLVFRTRALAELFELWPVTSPRARAIRRREAVRTEVAAWLAER